MQNIHLKINNGNNNTTKTMNNNEICQQINHVFIHLLDNDGLQVLISTYSHNMTNHFISINSNL